MTAMDVKVTYYYDWDNNVPGKLALGGFGFITSDFRYNQYNASGGAPQWIELGTNDPTNGKFLTKDDAVAYYSPSGITNVIGQLNSGYAGSGLSFTAGALIEVDETVAEYVKANAGFTAATSALSISLVTSTSAGGTQISATKFSKATASVKIDTSISLSGNAVGYVVAEVAPTNSTTAGDWVTVGRVDSGQSGTLVVGLALNQTGGGQLSADVPAGYYVRFRSVNTTGTPTYTLSGARKTIYG